MTKLLSGLAWVFVAGASLVSLPVPAAVNPRIEWRSAHTLHFDLIYDAQQQELAQIYADRLEKARAKLAGLWPRIPQRITVILNDRTDLTNGYATAMPYAHIMIFPVLPGPTETISEYGDWAEEIALHEMTHILSFEQRRGAVRVLSSIFGTIITPNILLPSWWLEGVAVDAETRLSRHGRLRSNYQDAALRALASDSRWPEIRLAEITEADIPTYPYGSRPYLYGSLLWSEMIAIKGEKMISDLHEAFGGRMPYFLSGPVQDRFDGDDLPRLWARTQGDVARAVEAQRAVLQKQPFSVTPRFVDPDFRETFNPRISPDGLKLAFLAKDDSLKRSIQILVRPNLQDSFSAGHRIRTFGQKEEITSPNGVEIKIPRDNPDAPPGGTINRISWSPDSQSFVFDLVGEVDMFHDVSDLWSFSLPKGRAEQLTHDLRAREPEQSPDGQRIAFVQLEAGRTNLSLFDRAAGTSRVLYRPGYLERVSWPVWLDSQRVLVTLRSKGTENFLVIDTVSGRMENPQLPFHEVSLPFVKAGHLYFVSNASGVRNLYRCDLNFKNVKAMTHLWTGAYASDLDESKNELWLTQLAASGFELTKKPQADVGPQEPLPAVEPLLKERYPTLTGDENAPVSGSMTESEPYSVFPYLWPHYWLPFIYWDDKTTQVSVSTGSFDPLMHHSYSIFASYDSAIHRGSYSLLYQNQNWKPTLTLQASDLSSYLANPDYPTRTSFIQIGSSWQLADLSPDLYVSIGAIGLKREQVGLLSEQAGPTVGLRYLKVQQTGDQISPESGGTATLQTTQFLEGGSREHYNLTELNGVKYGRLPWGHHHAWMIRFAGQKVDRDLAANYESTVTTLATMVPTTASYLMRGYTSGAFLGSSIANTSLEYRFPLSRIDQGGDKFALFVKRVSGAIVADGIWLEGYAYDTTQAEPGYRRVSSWKGYGSAGGEMKLDFTLGYHFEGQLILGLYAPLSPEFSDSSPRMGLGLLL